MSLEKKPSTALSQEQEVGVKRLLTAYDLMDGARALAAMAVLLSHERNILFLDATVKLSTGWELFYFLTGFGHEAVMIFFVLSGYWITKTVVRRSAEGRFPWSDYAIDRLSRLWIVLIPGLLVGGLFDSIGRYGIEASIYLGTQGTNTLTWDVATRLSLSNLVGNLVFLQTLLVEPLGSNAPLWSLANEFWYYVWFPPLYQVIRKQRPPNAIALVFLITIVAFRNLLPGFVCWLFGSLLYFATRRPSFQAPARRAIITTLPAAIVFFVGMLCLSRTHLPIDDRLKDAAVSGSFAILLFALIRSGRSYPRALAPLCRYGSASSYSLYVVHFPLILLLAALFFPPAHRLPPSGGLLLVFAGIGCVAITYGYGVSMITEAKTFKLRCWLKKQIFAGA